MGAQEPQSGNELIGRILGGKFKLRCLVGAGSSGTVYQADQITLGRTVAVKLLNPELASDQRLVSRFHDEALAASRLNHPNTVSVIDYGQAEDGLLFIVMEYLRGVTLTRMIREESPFRPERLVEVASQILSGLEEAHEAGVVHADLKADNIVVERRRGGWYLVKVVDFGIARIIGAPRSKEDESTICGTPEYMSPEVISGNDPTFASDLYAVGVTLYEMLTGVTPFVGGSSIEVLTRHIRETPIAPSARCPERSIDSKLEACVMRALAKHPNDRFASATEFRKALEATLVQRQTRTEDQILCSGCGVYSAARFRFCPECGYPRGAVVQQEASYFDTVPLLASAPVPVAPVPGGFKDPPTLHDAAGAGAARAEADVGGSIFPLPLIGRDTALDAILEFVDGSGSTMLALFGPTGMGRTRLLQEARERLEDHPDVTLYCGTEDPTGLKAPFYPIRNLVASVLALPPVCPYDRLSAGLELLGLSRRDLPGVAELFGHHGELWQLEPEVRRRELFASTIRVLRAATDGRGKAVFLLDDVDRYDQPSRALLEALAALEDESNLRVVVTHSPELADSWPECVVRLGLPALDEDDFAGLAVHLEQLGRDNLPSARTMAVRTRGNPTHLQHLMRFLVEGGQIDQAPTQLADLIAERIAGMPHPARVLCQSAAVFGNEVHRDLLRHALRQRLEGAALKTALSVVKARGLMYERPDSQTLAFGHNLIRDVVYDATPADVRRELHANAIKALEPTTADPLPLGHHYELAGHFEKAAQLLLRAGDDAIHQLDDAGAIALYQRAHAIARQLMLAEIDGPHRINFVVLSVKLADALRVNGQLTLARGIVEEAKASSRGAPRLEAQLLQASAHLNVCEHRYSDAIEALDRGIGLVIPVGDMELLAQLYLDLSSVYIRNQNHDKAVKELREGIDVVTLGEDPESTEGPKLLWRMLLRLAQLHSSAERLPQAVQFAELALIHTRRTRSRIGSARVQSLLAGYYEQIGDLRLADKYRQAAVSEMRRLGDRRGTAELLLSGVIPTRTLMRINPANLYEARTLADEIGWTEGVLQASRKTSQLEDL